MNETLVAARKELGLTQSQAAERIGISHGMLAMLETGQRNGGDETKIRIAEFYGKSIEELFYKHKITNSDKTKDEQAATKAM